MRSLLLRTSLWSMAGLLLLSVSGCTKPPEQLTTEEKQLTVPGLSIKSHGAANFVLVTYDAGTEKCVVSKKTEHMYAAPAQVLLWHVKNACVGPDKKGRPVNVFKIEFDPEDPTIHGGLEDEIRYNKTETFVAQVKDRGQVTAKSYPYYFWVDGVRQADPDVIIEFETFVLVPSLRTGPGGNR